MHPFSITLFATTGQPEGIRHVDKSNWSGCGVVFTKDLVSTLKVEPGSNKAAVYILVGNAAEETIYIGEADPVGDRLKTHVAKKEGWTWGVYFFDQNNKIGKTEVQYLEARLVALAKQRGRAIITNQNSPTEPTMSPAAKASAQAFLADMLLILPMLGINAFMESKLEEASEQAQPVGIDSDAFDTIVIPARPEGFQKVFLGENVWYAVRINAKHIPKLKYIAGYQVAPIAAITHLAEIASIEPYGDTGKYKLNFKGPAKRIVDIPRSADSDVSMQSPRYALLEKLQAAKNLEQIWT
jgi:predicted GIY-YIG superfamily endonuclease